MTEYINKENLIKAIEDKRPLNWNDTEAELAEQGAYDDIIGSIEGFNEEESDRINELMEADKEGRCLVLPCKVGDVLYKSTRTFVSSFKVAFIEVSMCNCLFIHTNLISGINMTGEIFKEDDIGKSVFLTEEEAEKALEGLECNIQ